MGIEYKSVVDHPLAEVVAWQPRKVLEETESPAGATAAAGRSGRPRTRRGDRFRHPSIDDALAHELGHG
jgi:hypothetical protein